MLSWVEHEKSFITSEPGGHKSCLTFTNDGISTNCIDAPCVLSFNSYYFQTSTSERKLPMQTHLQSKFTVLPFTDIMF